MNATFDQIRSEIIVKLTEAYKTGKNDRFIDVDALATVLLNTSEQPLKSLSDVDDASFWSLTFRYPNHTVPEWFDFAWIPVYDD